MFLLFSIGSVKIKSSAYKMMDSQYLYIPLQQLSPRQHGQVFDYEKVYIHHFYGLDFAVYVLGTV